MGRDARCPDHPTAAAKPRTLCRPARPMLATPGKLQGRAMAIMSVQNARLCRASSKTCNPWHTSIELTRFCSPLLKRTELTKPMNQKNQQLEPRTEMGGLSALRPGPRTAPSSASLARRCTDCCTECCTCSCTLKPKPPPCTHLEASNQRQNRHPHCIGLSGGGQAKQGNSI